jgi:hypothetical protein
MSGDGIIDTLLPFLKGGVKVVSNLLKNLEHRTC